MSRSPDSGRFDLAEVFRRVQQEMLAQLAVSGLLEHASSNGTATEQLWLQLFDRYLPRIYRARPAFVIDAHGRRSRQIDIAIFDNFQSPLLFPHSAGLHIPIECVYAVFEVKPAFSRQWLRDAVEKAASVRTLDRKRRPILAGLLATGAVWNSQTFPANLRRALQSTPLDLGCSLKHGAFETTNKSVSISPSDEALIFFVLRLIERLRTLGPAPPADLMHYARNLRSFQK